MQYTEEQLKTVAEAAGLLFRISDIAILIDVDPQILKEDIADRKQTISRAYKLSKLAAIAKLRKQEIEMAELGSNTAVELVSKYIIDQQLDE